MGINMLRKNILISISLLGLVACGGGGGKSSSAPAPVIKNGVFKDSNVFGLSYASGGQKGLTDIAGKFRYEDGKDVNFSIGKIDFGSGLGQAVMTPLDLVENGKLSDLKVINRIRLLMMLDKDNTPSNGIEISPKVRAKAKDWTEVDFTSTNFLGEVNTIIVDASVEDGVSHALPSTEAARAHLRTTLLCSVAGAFVGEYAGTESGNLALMLDPVTGNVKGSSYNPDNQVSVVVNSLTAIDTDSGLGFESSEDSAKKFIGSITSSDEMKGTWLNINDADSKGAFDASRVGGKSNAVFRYTVAYISDSDKGLYAFDVAANNAISGFAYSVVDKSDKTSALTGTLSVDPENNEKLILAATAENGAEINGKVNKATLTLEGVWSNVSALAAGTFSGGGCKLN
jgi:hypothetical protein